MILLYGAVDFCKLGTRGAPLNKVDGPPLSSPCVLGKGYTLFPGTTSLSCAVHLYTD